MCLMCEILNLALYNLQELLTIGVYKSFCCKSKQLQFLKLGSSYSMSQVIFYFLFEFFMICMVKFALLMRWAVNKTIKVGNFDCIKK